MLKPLIRRPRGRARPCSKERGFTMALVAVSLVAIIGMAALSIDLGTLYGAKAEAQRAADAAALAAARMISITGITGDPSNIADGWQLVCGNPANSPATLAAISVAQQNLISGVMAPTIEVNYGAGNAPPTNPSCVSVGQAFAVNPTVSVKVTSAALPIFFARVFSLLPGGNYSGTTVSATATAEAFNPSSSTVTGNMIPVVPRCVKPWIIPNIDPGNNPSQFVSRLDGTVVNRGVWSVNKGTIGETFNMNADCVVGAGNCQPPAFPAGNMLNYPPQLLTVPTQVLQYVPAAISGTAGATPACAAAGYQAAIAGCDQTTVYACGTLNGTQLDLTENPVRPTAIGGDSATAAECLIDNSAGGAPGSGQDVLNTTAFPFQIQPGSANPLAQAGIVSAGVSNSITVSNSIVTIPIYDNTVPLSVAALQPVTIVGFLQVFINSIDTNGNISVTVMNVSGCGDNAAGNPTVTGTSPVPIRLITQP
jgi:Flp pilus assembly protein TadG